MPHRGGARLAVTTAAAFGLVLTATLLVARAPLWPLALYAVLSTVAYFMYGADKNAAQQHQWRISEGALHIVALLGGWPGALIAQQVFRHKTRKLSFQLVFWITVAVNCGLLALLVSAEAMTGS